MISELENLVTHTTKDPFQSRLVKNILKCRWEELNFVRHDDGKHKSNVKSDL